MAEIDHRHHTPASPRSRTSAASDASRFGQATGGASDQYSAEVANALVGSARTAPLLELVAMDFSAVVSTDLLVAVTGAPADVQVGGVSPARSGNRSCGPQAKSSPSAESEAGFASTSPSTDRSTRPYLLGSCAPDSVLGFGRQLTAGEFVAHRRRRTARSTTRTSGSRCSGSAPDRRPSPDAGRST